MSVTLDVSHEETSTDSSREQPENMEDMLVASETSHPERSSSVSE